MKFFLGVSVACSGVALALAGGAGCGAATSPLLLFEDGGASDGAGSSSGGSSGSSSGVSSSSSGGSSGGSGGSSGGSGGSSGGSGSSSGASSSSSGGSGSGSGSSSSSGGSSGGGTGSLYFEECAGSSSVCGSTQAYFFGSFTQGSTTTCAPSVTSGACMLYTSCNTAPTPGVSAGTITISGGDIAGSIAVMADPNNFDEYDYTATSSIFSAGQTLTLFASGATVPSFGPISVVAPANATLTAPAVTSTGGYTIATSMDLAVAWNGGQAGSLIIFEGAANPMAQTQSYFVCTWDASLGRATVPQGILAGLAGQSNAVLYYGQITTTNFTAGGYAISVNALPFGGGSASFQ